LKKKAVVATAAALGIALLFCAQGARAAAPASDNGSAYQNPWGPANPQSQPNSGFAPWVYDQWNPDASWNSIPPPNLFFIDTARGAWGINMPADIVSGHGGFDAAWISFTGDQPYLSPGQTYSTTVLFTPPGTRGGTLLNPQGTPGGTETPGEGVDFFAQNPGQASNPTYDGFGHQVFGIYLGQNADGVTRFDVSFHTALSDENPEVNLSIPLPFTGTASSPQEVKVIFTQRDQGNWVLKMISGDNAVVLNSQEYGATWNTAQGLDGVRYFTTQGGTSPGGPTEWKNASVSQAPTDTKDFAGGGYADLAWENTTTGQRAIWFLKNGAVSSTTYLPTTPVQWHIAGVGDFAGDGNADLVWENTSTGQRAIWYLKNGVVSSTAYLPTLPVQWHIVGVGDFKGDGNADLVWENSSTGQRAIWYLQNGAVTSSTYLPTIPVEWHIAGVGDFNNDGNDDLVWENTRTGQRAIWFIKNGAVSSTINLPTVPVQWRIAGAGDFSGNGYAGLVWQNTATGERAIWYMKNGAVTSTTNLPKMPLTWSIVDH
jgi:FG-GAP-like repeat